MIEVTVLERGEVRVVRLQAEALDDFEAALQARGGTLLDQRRTRGGPPRRLSRPSAEAWAPWFSALARTLQGGVPLDRTLDLLAEAAPEPDSARRLHQAVVGGRRFSEAVAQHLESIPDLIPALLRTGEAAGDLARGARLAHRGLVERAKFRRELRGRLAYPVVVVSAATLALVVLLLKVFPALTGMWTNLGRPLPPRLQVLQWSGWASVGLLAGLTGGLSWLMAGKEGAHRLPGFRRLGLHRTRTEAWSALAMALGGGVSLLEALNLLGERWEAAELRRAIQEGGRPEQVLDAWVADAPGQRAVLLAGLRVGDLAGGAASVAEGYREMLEEDLQRLQRWLEPAVLILLGTILLGLAWSLFSLMGEMEHGLVR
ncbi:type II secretion system F family protein [Geothrix sp. 21YS21S-4]|uniref:type II secretion system F family protein n=1 Tax=Geothrix sp. 21YS21S-4 TaxID=3068889 RepID=UPI0027BAC150|nr:type II secretion system F family protein [Geothrix sp. 21YS21S-4]